MALSRTLRVILLLGVLAALSVAPAAARVLAGRPAKAPLQSVLEYLETAKPEVFGTETNFYRQLDFDALAASFTAAKFAFTKPTTFFAPTNSAWAALAKHGGPTPGKLGKFDPLGAPKAYGQLASTFLSLVVSGSYTPEQLVKKRRINSVLGDLTGKERPLNFSPSDHGKVYISDNFGRAALLGKPVKVVNGTLYAIETVMLPAKTYAKVQSQFVNEFIHHPHR